MICREEMQGNLFQFPLLKLHKKKILASPHFPLSILSASPDTIHPESTDKRNSASTTVQGRDISVNMTTFHKKKCFVVLVFFFNFYSVSIMMPLK